MEFEPRRHSTTTDDDGGGGGGGGSGATSFDRRSFDRCAVGRSRPDRHPSRIQRRPPSFRLIRVVINISLSSLSSLLNMNKNETGRQSNQVGKERGGGGTPNGDETIRTRKGLKTDNSTHTQTHTHTRNHRKQQQKQRGSQSAPRCPWRDGLIPDCQSIKTLRGGWEREGRRGGGISICRDLWWRQTVSRVAVVQGVDQVSVWRRSAGGCHQFGEWVIGRAASGHAEDVGELGGAQRLQHTVEQLLDVQLAAALAQTIAYRFVKVGRIPVDDWSRLSKLRSSNSHRVEFICHLIRSKIDLIYVT